MSKRLVRIPTEQASSLINKQVSVVMRSGAVLLVKPKSIKDNIIKATDTRESKMLISLSDIAEIWADQKAI